MTTRSDPSPPAGASAPRFGPKRLLLLGLSLLATALFLALGIWQVERRAWKLDLIARVEARLAAAPVPAPGRAEWPKLPAMPTSTAASRRPAASCPTAQSARWR